MVKIVSFYLCGKNVCLVTLALSSKHHCSLEKEQLAWL